MEFFHLLVLRLIRLELVCPTSDLLSSDDLNGVRNSGHDMMREKLSVRNAGDIYIANVDVGDMVRAETTVDSLHGLDRGTQKVSFKQCESRS